MLPRQLRIYTIEHLKLRVKYFYVKNKILKRSRNSQMPITYLIQLNIENTSLK